MLFFATRLLYFFLINFFVGLAAPSIIYLGFFLTGWIFISQIKNIKYYTTSYTMYKGLVSLVVDKGFESIACKQTQSTAGADAEKGIS